MIRGFAVILVAHFLVLSACPECDKVEIVDSRDNGIVFPDTEACLCTNEPMTNDCVCNGKCTETAEADLCLDLVGPVEYSVDASSDFACVASGYSRSPVERTAACNENNLCAWWDGYGCMRQHGIKTHEFSLAEFLARLDGAYLDKVLKVRQLLNPDEDVNSTEVTTEIVQDLRMIMPGRSRF